MDQPLHIHFAETAVVGALAAVGIYLIPPRAPVVVAEPPEMLKRAQSIAKRESRISKKPKP